MSDDYTPTTEQVEQAFLEAGPLTMNGDAALLAFRRWLAEYRRQVIEEAVEAVFGMERAFVTDEWGTVVRKLDVRDTLRALAEKGTDMTDPNTEGSRTGGDRG